MWSRFANYFAASNKSFAVTFPAAVLVAACMRSMSDHWFWMVPAAVAVIEAIAKVVEVWKRKQM